MRDLTLLEWALIGYSIVSTLAFILTVMVQAELHKEIKRLTKK